MKNPIDDKQPGEITDNRVEEIATIAEHVIENKDEKEEIIAEKVITREAKLKDLPSRLENNSFAKQIITTASGLFDEHKSSKEINKVEYMNNLIDFLNDTKKPFSLMEENKDGNNLDHVFSLNLNKEITDDTKANFIIVLSPHQSKSKKGSSDNSTVNIDVVDNKGTSLSVVLIYSYSNCDETASYHKVDLAKLSSKNEVEYLGSAVASLHDDLKKTKDTFIPQKFIYCCSKLSTLLKLFEKSDTKRIEQIDGLLSYEKWKDKTSEARVRLIEKTSAEYFVSIYMYCIFQEDTESYNRTKEKAKNQSIAIFPKKTCQNKLSKDAYGKSIEIFIKTMHQTMNTDSLRFSFDSDIFINVITMTHKEKYLYSSEVYSLTIKYGFYEIFKKYVKSGKYAPSIQNTTIPKIFYEAMMEIAGTPYEVLEYLFKYNNEKHIKDFAAAYSKKTENVVDFFDTIYKNMNEDIKINKEGSRKYTTQQYNDVKAVINNGPFKCDTKPPVQPKTVKKDVKPKEKKKKIFTPTKKPAKMRLFSTVFNEKNSSSRSNSYSSSQSCSSSSSEEDNNMNIVQDIKISRTRSIDESPKKLRSRKLDVLHSEDSSSSESSESSDSSSDSSIDKKASKRRKISKHPEKADHKPKRETFFSSSIVIDKLKPKKESLMILNNKSKTVKLTLKLDMDFFDGKQHVILLPKISNKKK